MPQTTTHTTINSLDDLLKRKQELSEEISKSEGTMGDIWHKMFHEPTMEEKLSPTQRALNFISSSAGLIDGLLLGWKLYCKFSGTKRAFSFFRRKRKK